MKKLFTILFLAIFLIPGCQKEIERDAAPPVPELPKTRLQYKNQLINIVPGPGTKNLSLERLGYTFVLVAEVDAPEVNGQTVQATHVAIEGVTAYVSYNMRGPQNLGALDIIDISDPSFPVIIKTLVFENRDINTVGLYNGLIVVAGQDSNGAFYGFIDPEDEENNLEVHRLPSHSAMGLVISNDLIYLVSGKNGGLTIVDSEGNQEYFPVFEVRSVAVGEEVYVLSQEKIQTLSGTEVVLDPGYVQSASKADLEFSVEFVFAALNRGGAHIYNTSDLSLLQAIPRPSIPEGANPENYVTNSLSFNNPLLFLANGGACIAVNLREYATDTIPAEFIEFGYFDFGGPVSSNYVKSNRSMVFVATGLGGLKILTFYEDSE